MRQFTAKRLVEALYWLDNNAHHEAGVEFKNDRDPFDKWTHSYFRNYHEKLRVPRHLDAEVRKYIRPNRRKFDTRMFAVTTAGKRMISR